MRRRKLNAQFTIDVRPFLGILASIQLVIALTFTVCTIRIDSYRVTQKFNIVGSSTRKHSGKVRFAQPKKPTFLICGPESVTIQPGNTTVTWDELHQQNAIESLLDKIDANSSNEYVVLLAQPESTRCFRQVRHMLYERIIDVTVEVVDANFKFPQDLETIQGYIQSDLRAHR